MLAPTRHSNVVIQLLDEVLRLHGRLKSVFAGVSSMTGLTSMEATVLSAVVEADTPPTVPQIGRSLGHPRQVIQRAANALVQTGLLSTGPNPNHRRAPLLLPTAKGRALKHKADDRAAKVVEALLPAVDEEQCRHLMEMLHQLRGGIEAHLRARNESDATERKRSHKPAKSHRLARSKHSRTR